MSIAKRIEETITKMDAGDFEGALIPTSIAVDATAIQQYPNTRNSTAYKNFIHDNFEIISKVSSGGTVTIGNLKLKYNHPDITPDQDGMCSIEQILYHVVRCGLLHKATLPSDLKFINKGMISVENNSLTLPAGFIYGLLAAVVVSPSNKDQRISSNSVFNIHGNTISPNELWGDKKKLLRFYEGRVDDKSKAQHHEINIGMLHKSEETNITNPTKVVGKKPKEIVNESDNGSQSARAIAIRSAAAELEQIANNFENWAKKHHAKYVDPNGVKPPAFTRAQIEDWVNTYLLKQRLVAVFFSHPHLSYDKNSGLTPFLTTYERKQFHLIVDVFRLHMPAIATSLKELYDEFWEDVRYHIKCHERSKKVQQENIPSIGESIENTFWNPTLFLDGTVLSTVKRLRHIAKIAKGNLATSGPAETEQQDKDTKKEREGMIEPKPPDILAKILWILRYGRKWWWLLLLALAFMILPLLPRFTCSKEDKNSHLQGETSSEKQSKEKRLQVTLTGICAEIDSVPLAQQSESAKQYLGMMIKRERLRVDEIQTNLGQESIYDLRLTLPDEASSPNSQWIILCTVSKDQYPQLRIAREGMEFYVSGEIAETFWRFGERHIMLSNVTLEFE